MNDVITPSLFEYDLSDIIDSNKIVPKEQAEKIMRFFKQHPLFKWHDSNNLCEARADAVCVLLEEWGVPSFKAWVFSGKYLKGNIGGLKQNWNYHVATMLQVMENEELIYYVIDPSTSGRLQKLYSWAASITEYPHSYVLIKEADKYIFSDKKITRNNWNSRNSQNRKWMIEGLAGINGVGARGKAQLVFNKSKIKTMQAAFVKLEKERPFEGW